MSVKPESPQIRPLEQEFSRKKTPFSEGFCWQDVAGEETEILATKFELNNVFLFF
jgi:hypothetical protein